ncbi:nanos homolog 2 [Sphaeramia orbicularis]|uniref:Nanos homolog 2-like n=1 Tax=Sphaeramia orbicularis TaxID=375764 RepID=A0A673CED5_9TELE|nr:nanos homolog 2-like [Sphaeramia orbicularis]
MSTMQRQLGLQCATLPDAGAFDMWHDYMNLGRLLLNLDGTREMDRADTEGPKKEPTGDPWRTIQAGAARPNLRRTSAETSSASSLSDSSSTGASSDFCRFCKQNGESAKVYRSHSLKSKGKVVCPILWSYTCPTCGATGDHAHTRKYCPRGDDRMLPRSRVL